MMTFILASDHPETGEYLQEKVRSIPSILPLANCRRMEELSDLIRKHRPDGLLLDLSPAPEALLTLADELQKEFPSLLVLLACQKFKCDQDLLLKAMQLGIRGFYPIPFDQEAASNIERLTQKASGQVRGSGRGRLVCVLSSKGGSGSTIIASNLAVALAHHRKKSTALIDLNLQLGDVSLFLDLKPQATVADLAKNTDRLDATLLTGMMTRHWSGLQVLAAPKLLEEAGLLTHAHLRKGYFLLKSLYEWVVVDLPVAFDEPMLSTFEHADDILLVTLLNIPSLRNTKRHLSIFERLGIPKERVRVIINRYDHRADGALSLREAEKALGHPLYCNIPNNYPVAISAINQGVPLASVAPDAPIVKAFDELAGLLVRPNIHKPAGGAGMPMEMPDKTKQSVFGRLFKNLVEAT